MRFLGVGDSCDLGALYLRLIADGHQVKVSVAEPLAQETMAGLVEHTADWEEELGWVTAKDDGIILFENVAGSRGALQDQLRTEGYRVIGGSAYGDRLENDRAYAQRILREIGLQSCALTEFHDASAACQFIERHPSRYVLKFNGPGFSSHDNFVGRLPDGSDVRAVLSSWSSETEHAAAGFVLMEHVTGVEMGVGAYFNGERFVGRPCLDWEHKRFFPGDLGELTGEMGTIATFDRSRHFFERTLFRMTPLLQAGGYCGYINLNTIVNDSGIWPLEFTCRFGYPGFAVLGPLQKTPWADLFKAMALRTGDAEMRSGFSAAIVMTTPPFPFTRKDVRVPIGLPVLFDADVTEKDAKNLFYGEVGLRNNQLVTTGLYGWTMVATGVADTIAGAQAAACALADKVLIPNVRYRRDIGSSLVRGGYANVETLGLFDSP